MALPWPFAAFGRSRAPAFDPRLRALTRDAYDLVVVGGGVRALALARACARNGTSVALIAPGEIAGAAEERAWPVARSAHVDPLRMAAHRAGPKRMAKLARKLPLAVDWERSGCLTIADRPHEIETLTEVGLRAKAIGVDAWMVPPREVAALSPPVADGSGLAAALHDASAVTVDVDALAFAIADDAAAAGAELVDATLVEALERDGPKVTGVRLAGRTIRARSVVLSDDLSAIRLVREGKGRLSLKREERLILTTEPDAPSIGPALVIDDVTVARDLSGAIIASGPVGDDALARRLVALAPSFARLAVVGEEPVTVWTGVDGRSQVGAAEIEGLWLSLGFGREALSAALPAAKHLATLLAGRTPDPAFDPYAPTRRAPIRERETTP
jgi:glycine/D-amino acid oxidase-like deaminating enzyme